MARSFDERGAFRCTVAPENSAAKLKLGYRLHNVWVMNTSRDGFCVRAPNALAKRITERKRPVLIFGGERWIVQLKSRYSDSSKFTNIGFARVREVMPNQQGPTGWSFALMPRSSPKQDPTFLVFLMIAFALAVISLPGLGDSLGTAPKVRTMIQSVMGSAR